jgi:hypothetical protein
MIAAVVVVLIGVLVAAWWLAVLVPAASGVWETVRRKVRL